MLLSELRNSKYRDSVETGFVSELLSGVFFKAALSFLAVLLARTFLIK